MIWKNSRPSAIWKSSSARPLIFRASALNYGQPSGYDAVAALLPIELGDFPRQRWSDPMFYEWRPGDARLHCAPARNLVAPFELRTAFSRQRFSQLLMIEGERPAAATRLEYDDVAAIQNTRYAPPACCRRRDEANVQDGCVQSCSIAACRCTANISGIGHARRNGGWSRIRRNAYRTCL